MYKQAEEEKAARKKNRRKPLPPKSVFWRYVLLAAGLFVLLLIFAAVGVALTLWRLFNATFKRKLLFELKSQKILFVTGTNYCIAEPIWHLRHCVIGLVLSRHNTSLCRQIFIFTRTKQITARDNCVAFLKPPSSCTKVATPASLCYIHQAPLHF